VQGGADLTAPPELAKTYLDSITAPRKGFYLVPGAGHQPNRAALAIVHRILLEQIRPLAQ
jgi:pimeloyl-ACP methyl ester carboxylesterase